MASGCLQGLREEGGLEQTIGLVLPILLTLSMRNPEPATVIDHNNKLSLKIWGIMKQAIAIKLCATLKMVAC